MCASMRDRAASMSASLMGPSTSGRLCSAPVFVDTCDAAWPLKTAEPGEDASVAPGPGPPVSVFFLRWCSSDSICFSISSRSSSVGTGPDCCCGGAARGPGAAATGFGCGGRPGSAAALEGGVMPGAVPGLPAEGSCTAAVLKGGAPSGVAAWPPAGGKPPPTAGRAKSRDSVGVSGRGATICSLKSCSFKPPPGAAKALKRRCRSSGLT
mmetsp:Transcript_72342/g.215899  ORF Transcript_72342/g.215899 Transcript_72342/m.215899 type:complete len:210 (+) Transcript_72342:521-1150(+)